MPHHYRSRFYLSPKQESLLIKGLLTIAVMIIAMKFLDRITHSSQYENSEVASRGAVAYINEIRTQYGKSPIEFDDRIFALANARIEDMIQYNYYDHTNPQTGSCADNMKTDFDLTPDEFVAENILEYGDIGGIRSQLLHPMSDAVDSWMDSRGHRYNLLYDDHIAGAVACYGNKCIFLGLNHNRFGQGCYTAVEGHQHWLTAPLQPGEITPD
jgi:uncharacterized protein YkwD